MNKLFITAAAAFFCIAGCKDQKLVTSAAEYGLRKDLKAVGEVLNFREISTEEKEAPGGLAAVVRFESELKWYTLEEAFSSSGSASNTREYLGKVEYVSARLGTGPKAGGKVTVKGAILMAKTDTGWIYKGLAAE